MMKEGKMKLTKDHVIRAKERRSDWDFGNQVLYDMCRKHPRHDEKGVVLGKIWLIGRAYAATIERGRKGSHLPNDKFYTDIVWPRINSKNSGIDEMFDDLRKDSSTKNILKVHRKLAELFKEINGKMLISLASKYLHFHFPDLFFIYDTRAVKAVSMLSGIAGRAGRNQFPESDNEYRKFYEKCSNVRDAIENDFGERLSPRVLDNLLLMIEEESGSDTR